MYTHHRLLHESAPSDRDPGTDRSRGAGQPGNAAKAAATARLRRDAGDDLARHQGARPREARRRVSAAGRRGAKSGDGADRARAGRRRVPPSRRAGAAARGHPYRRRPGTAARDCARPRAAARGRRHDWGRRHDSCRGARRARRGDAGKTLEGLHRRMTRIALAYSGSPHTSHAIGWLADVHAAEVVTLTLDLGQGRRLEAVRDRALAMGASRAHVLDVHEEFAREYFLRALRADALLVDGRSLVSALSRPLLAQKLVEIADIEQTTTVAHACA